MDIKIMVEAMEMDEIDDWEAAHRIIQHWDTPIANWIHAYLHRKEGDLWNANYWYDRANRVMPKTKSLDDEAQEIREFLENL
jgi:hypothetical protein